MRVIECVQVCGMQPRVQIYQNQQNAHKIHIIFSLLSVHKMHLMLFDCQYEYPVNWTVSSWLL